MEKLKLFKTFASVCAHEARAVPQWKNSGTTKRRKRKSEREGSRVVSKFSVLFCLRQSLAI